MHASLACMSPEVLALNAIIRLRSSGMLQVDAPSTASILSIPPEILLAIRGHLLPLVIRDLSATSAEALTAYEAARGAQMCDDCVVYHTHVFGADTWNWPPNSICRCRDGTSFSPFSRTPASLAHSRKLSRPKPATPQDWLEFYLSKCAKRVLAARHGARASMNLNIWDLVASVLREFECGVLRDNSGAISPAGALVSIVSLPLEDSLAPNQDTAWCVANTLRRVERELGLLFIDANVGIHKSKASHERSHKIAHIKKGLPILSAYVQLFIDT